MASLKQRIDELDKTADQIAALCGTIEGFLIGPEPAQACVPDGNGSVVMVRLERHGDQLQRILGALQRLRGYLLEDEPVVMVPGAEYPKR